MSEAKFLVVHRSDVNNVGDIASNPLQYFLKPEEYKVIDILNLNHETLSGELPVIVGGGGLLGNEFFGDTLRKVVSAGDDIQLSNLWNVRWELSDSRNREAYDEFVLKFQSLISETKKKIHKSKVNKILWGAGINGEFNKKKRETFDYPDYLSEFDLVGVRDWGQSLPWVPCASCMNTSLEKSYPIKNDIIFFEHKKQLIKDFGKESIPRYVNSGSNVEQTIELLGSANIILTNSYHGAYWGKLLKKRVVVVSPWSNKFSGMRHKPAFAWDMNGVDRAIEEATIDHTALDECKQQTVNFWNRVKNLR